MNLPTIDVSETKTDLHKLHKLDSWRETVYGIFFILKMSESPGQLDEANGNLLWESQIEKVLNGEKGFVDLPIEALEYLRSQIGAILIQQGVVTLHRGDEDTYGQVFMYRDSRGRLVMNPPEPNASFFRVRRAPFVSVPSQPGDPEEIQKRAMSGGLPFDYTPTRHMVVAAHKERRWSPPLVIPVGSMQLDPLADRYGQTTFGGAQCYRLENGDTVIFRPDLHARRFSRNADRMMMPEMSTKTLVRIFEETVRSNWDFVPPTGKGRLYLAPGLRAAINQLGVDPNKVYYITCMGVPVGAIFGKKPLRLKVEKDFHRSAKGGVGNVKAAGNYGPVLRLTARLQREGFDDSLFTDNENRFVREQRASNSFFITANDVLVTPSLSPEILDGVTRASILEVAQELVEERYIAGVMECEIPLGKLAEMREAFACGTGVTIAPIGEIFDEGQRYEMDLNQDGIGPVTQVIRNRLALVMAGKSSNPRYGKWLHVV